MHLLPQLRELEHRFGEALVIVGVHAGKFIAERVTENIRQAVIRLGVEHPVVNDRQYRIWRSYAVNAWPTLVLVSVEGRVVGQHVGETTADALAPVVERTIAAAEETGALGRTRLTFPLERDAEPERALRYPAKVAGDPATRRLAISDAGHSRVLLVRLDPGGRGGEVEAVVGRGERGFDDGAHDVATFDDPHGLAFGDGVLYVADTGNHALRAVERRGRWRVRTVAGTGEQAGRLGVPGQGRAVALNSPWDVLFHGGALYIAMAGPHQIWRFDFETGEVLPWAGTGVEALLDGRRGEAALAQPSGLATDGRRIFFADAEASAIRWAEIGPAGRVGTIVGTGLFDFGDRDGSGDQVRLQHPLGVAWRDGILYVADTYNGKVKVLDPETRTAVTWIGTDAGEVGGVAGARGTGSRLGAGGSARILWEPGGIATLEGWVYVADTNHHRVVVARPGADTVEELEIRGV